MNNNDTNVNGNQTANSFNQNGLGNNVPSNNINPGMNGLAGMSLGNVEQTPNSLSQFGNMDANMVPPVGTEINQTAPVSGGVTFSIPNVEQPTNFNASPMDTNVPTNMENPNGLTMNGQIQQTSNPGATSFSDASVNSSPMNLNNGIGQTANMGISNNGFSNNISNVGGMTTPDNNMNGSVPPAGMTQNNFANNSMAGGSNMDPNMFYLNGQSSNGGMNQILNSVPTPPLMNDFNQNQKPVKKGLSKPFIIILVILLIAIIGAGVYVVLNQTTLSKPKGSIIINDPITMPLGKELSTNVSDYATISGFDSTVCSLDLSKVDIKKMGSYDFTVTCGTTSKSGKIVLQDKEAPVVTTKEVVVSPGATITLEDFIVSCDDDSNCSYELADDSKSLKEMASTVGVYEFDLIVSDDYNNSTTVQLTLNVTNDAPVKYMYCTPAATDVDNMNATLETSYRYGINAEDGLSQSQKILNYVFKTSDDYLNAKDEFEADAGEVTFLDADFTITVTIDMTAEGLGNEFNVSPFPTNYDDLKEFHLNQGISCKNR